MLQTLPPEIVQRIVKCMLTFSPPSGTKLDTRPDKGVHLQSWNKIHERRHLFRLARTCKYLKSVVDPILYETWACHEKLSLAGVKGPEDHRMHGMNIGQETDPISYDMKVRPFPTCYFISKPCVNRESFRRKDEDALRDIALEYDPKFYLVAGYEDVPESALKYVKHLGLVINGYNAPHYFHLPQILPKMTSLIKVTLHLDAHLKKDAPRHVFGYEYAIDFMTAIHLLLRFKGNSLRVEFMLNISLYEDVPYATLFYRFFKEWSNWTKLNVDTLAICVSGSMRGTPEPFTNKNKVLKLKRFFCVNEYAFNPITGEYFDFGCAPEEDIIHMFGHGSYHEL